MGKPERGRGGMASPATGTAAATGGHGRGRGRGRGRGATAAAAAGRKARISAAAAEEEEAAAAAVAAATHEEEEEEAGDGTQLPHAPLLAAAQAAAQLASLPGLEPVLPSAEDTRPTSLLQQAPPVLLDSVNTLLAWQQWKQGPEGQAAVEQLTAQLPVATSDFEGARVALVKAARRLEGLLTDHETFHRNTQEAQEAMEYVEQCLAQRRAEREQREQQQQQEAVTGSAPQPP